MYNYNYNKHYKEEIEMIRTEIRFKNASFINALEKNNYNSIAEFSRESEISYQRLIEYANLKYLFKGKSKEKIINLLKSDEWTLFEQYREVIEKSNGENKKIVKDIPVDKMLSLSSKEVLQIESDVNVEENQELNNHFLKIELEKGLKTLKDRERKCIEMYYGLNGFFGSGENGGNSFDEIAKEFGVSKERARQIKEKAIRRMRHRSRSEKLKPFTGLKQFEEKPNDSIFCNHTLKSFNDESLDDVLSRNNINESFYTKEELKTIKLFICKKEDKLLRKFFGIYVSKAIHSHYEPKRKWWDSICLGSFIKIEKNKLIICYECLYSSIRIDYTDQLKRGMK